MSEPKGQYLLSIEPIPPKGVEPSQVACSEDNSPAYFVGSTAPNNVEQEVNPVTPPDQCIKTIAKQLVAGEQRELLVAIHGYNMSIGTYQQGEQPGAGVKGWYQDIWHHIAENGLDRSGLMLIGYRWPSERIRGEHTPPYGDDTLGAKIRSAQRALPKALKLVLIGAVALLVLLVAVALLTDWLRGAVLGTGGVALLIVAVMLLSIILTLFLLRIAGYFRDRYRANNFGVAELVELFRHLDRAILEATPEGRWKDAGADSVEAYWDNNRIKLSFIGHSMGSFVVTDTVRILSDVFDKHSIGNLALDGGAAKQPTREIGDVFSLERLVLVSPDIPAEAIISSRANFLRSSLRRFKEAYLFTNEGDMALKLASTAANYASFPASTRERGYRLGNVTVRIPEDSLDAQSHRYGIVNLMSLQKGDNSKASFLRYLYILAEKQLIEQKPDHETAAEAMMREPIAASFTVFDCTDYREFWDKDSFGLLTYALRKRALSFIDYVSLTRAYFKGRIDTHGGYFSAAKVDGVGSAQIRLPEAYLTKHLIYGLACLGFEGFLAPQSVDNLLSSIPADRLQPLPADATALEKLSQLCRDRQIQVLLSPQHYRQFNL